MLVARIKCMNRGEVRKLVFGNKQSFTYKGVSYKIKPDAVYRYTVFMLFAFNAIDYVQGDTEPVLFYDNVHNRFEGRKNIDTISTIVGKWLQDYILHFQLIVLILLGVCLALGVVNVIMTYLKGG